MTAPKKGLHDKYGRRVKYKPDFPKKLIEHMAKGYTFKSFAGRPDVGVCYDTLYHWCRLFPEFSEAAKQGRAAQLLKDEETGDKLVTGKLKGSAAYHIFKMKSCHGWTDRHEIVVAEAGDADLIKLAQELLSTIKEEQNELDY